MLRLLFVVFEEVFLASGTYTLEILEDLPDPDYIFVPIGGGSGAASILTVVRAMAPGVKVIGVQAEKAPAFYLSYRNGKPIETDSADTIAGSA